jgi:hypothetical protein
MFRRAQQASRQRIDGVAVAGEIYRWRRVHDKVPVEPATLACLSTLAASWLVFPELFIADA